MRATAQRSVSLRLADVYRPLWQWWSREIAAMMPTPLKRWLAGQQGRLIVTIERDQAILLRDLGGQRRRLGSFDLVNAEPGKVGEIAAIVGDHPILELSSDAALRRVVALPAAAESNLAEVVSFELERHTPFQRTEAYHAYRAIGRDPSQQRILIDLTAVPRAIVDDALKSLLRLGLDIGEVRVAATAAGADASPNLLPVRTASDVPRLPRLAISSLAVMAAALAVATIAIPIVRAHHEAAQLEVALQSARSQAVESARLQKEIDAALSDRGFLTARKRQTVPVSRLLDTLTRLLPDDTWLTELRIAGTDLEIAGSGASASAIIALIDGAPGLSEASFRSPVTQDQLRREQFDIGAHLRAGVRQ